MRDKHMKLLWRTDVHLADQGPVSRLDNWSESVFDKLKQVGELAGLHKVKAVIDGGDYFHVKSPSRNSHSLIQQTAQLHKDYPCPVLCNVGNHDVKFGDLKYLEESPLGVLFATGCFEKNFDSHDHTFIEDGLKIRVVGVPYHGTTYDRDYIRTLCTKKDEDYLFVHMHLLASPEGGTLFEGEDILSYSEISQLDADVFAFGHWHRDQGVAQIGNKTIINVGSLTRGSLSSDDLKRTPQTALLDFTHQGVKVTTLPLNVKPAKDVFDLVGRNRVEEASMRQIAFIEHMKDTLSLDTQKPLSDMIRDLPIDPMVKERALSYLE